MTFDPQCVFCRIVRGQAEAHVVHRDDHVTAFLDIHPVTRGHLLVVPNEHAADLAEVDPQALGRMMVTAQALAGALRRTPLGVDGINLHLADGADAGQSVFHCHLHIIPRYRGDGFGFRRPLGQGTAAREDLANVAGLLRAAHDEGGR
jgi:diadenosine tetraphosphate (Ap4A) HIT family hydrolase